jgi:putative addiction module component (TIGR02574 family)
MATIIEDIEAAALRLPRADRARLAELLWASLGDDPEVMKKWEVEIERRVREIREGKGRSIPAEQVFREIEEMLR